MQSLQSQTDASPLSGNLQANGNFFIRDSTIGAANTPQYDHQLVGADAWLSLNYNKFGYDIGVRFDIFQNSQLLNPKESYTASGFGRWYVKKRVGKLAIYGGHIYDQIGAGLIFRSYEDRPLGIDNALIGINLDYQINDNFHVKAFTGRQKQQFVSYQSTINGLNTEGYLSIGKTNLAAGLGIVHRTIDDATVSQLVSTISTYAKADSIAIKYNTFAFTAYNTLTHGKWTWYVETALKTGEAMFDVNANKLNRDGTLVKGKYINTVGSIIYTTLGYITEGVGVTLEAKRTQGFTFRTTPFAQLNRGIINYLPPLNRQNSYRLTTRYVPATQELGEQAIQLDIKLSPNEKINIDANISQISDLQNLLLYREIYTSVLLKKGDNEWTFGIQHQNYNQNIYESKPNVSNVQTITPFMTYFQKINNLKSYKISAQYMHTKQDYGSWIYGGLDFDIAPKWSFSISDMWNVVPKKTAKALHYPTLAAAFSQGANRFSLAYVKQVEGIVCTGGICRLEPAFSGVKMGVTTAF